MLVETANPLTSEMLESGGLQPGYAPVPVAVDVLSEDDGVAVENRFFLSARSSVQVMEPQNAVAGADLEPGNWSDGGRTMTAIFQPNALTEPGCYELFWLATHEADFRSCPVLPEDSTRISWTILICAAANCSDAEKLGCHENEPQIPCPSGGTTP